MEHTAQGKFEVDLKPLAAEGEWPSGQFGRMSINKKFSGDLEGVSTGQMISFTSGMPGSAGYVALEEVTGTLHGKRGSFVLQHNATMDRNTPELNIIIVPDSGTGELTGISGSLEIQVAQGQHRYSLKYKLKANS